jgi:2-succinyl-5-enolpyruvyl-6-hydroxy-3-cyclohexene-1-carboxylate synthase
MDERNLLTEWSRLLLASIADAGVTDVVISPGSRSSPFIMAAARERRLACHDVIDERAAAFFALGQARITGRPTLILCTSGSACAHYFPAILEAESACLPLLVMTADRPFELQACGAPQTIDQLDLYRGHVRQFFELGEPDGSDSALRAARRKIAQAAFATQYPSPGPVHLNVRASKPLEPVEPELPEEQALVARVHRVLTEPIVRASVPRVVPERDAIRRWVRQCIEVERGVIVCGPALVRDQRLRGAVYELARRLGYPLLAEATSQLRFGPSEPDVIRCERFELLYRSHAFRTAACPELALQLGAPPTSKGWEQLAHGHALRRVIVGAHGWADPHSTASSMLVGDPTAVVEALRDELVAQAPQLVRRGTWRTLYHDANAAVARLVEDAARGDAALSEADVIRATVDSLPADGTLVVGNSMPIRELDVFARCTRAPIRVLSQRGTNGIDGVVAGAVGAATSARQPVTLLIGDVSFLHDLTSLALARRVSTPLVIVVVNNRGGRIFELLPMSKVVGPEDMDHLITPHDTDFAAAAGTFHVPFERVTTRAQLAAALGAASDQRGCTLIEAVVPDHDAHDSMTAMLSKLDGALRPLLAGWSG